MDQQFQQKSLLFNTQRTEDVLLMQEWRTSGKWTP